MHTCRRAVTLGQDHLPSALSESLRTSLKGPRAPQRHSMQNGFDKHQHMSLRLFHHYFRNGRLAPLKERFRVQMVAVLKLSHSLSNFREMLGLFSPWRERYSRGLTQAGGLIKSWPRGSICVSRLYSSVFRDNQPPLAWARKPSPTPFHCNYRLPNSDNCWPLHFKEKHYSHSALEQKKITAVALSQLSQVCTPQGSKAWGPMQLLNVFISHQRHTNGQTVMFTSSLKTLQLRLIIVIITAIAIFKVIIVIIIISSELMERSLFPSEEIRGSVWSILISFNQHHLLTFSSWPNTNARFNNAQICQVQHSHSCM